MVEANLQSSTLQMHQRYSTRQRQLPGFCLLFLSAVGRGDSSNRISRKMWTARVQEEKAGPKGGFHHFQNLNHIVQYVKWKYE